MRRRVLQSLLVLAMCLLVAAPAASQFIGGIIQPGSSGSGTVTSVATTAPITGGTITGAGTIACATCATTTNGGAITGTAPVAVSAAGAISITGAAGQVLAGAGPAFTATPTLGASGTVGTIAFGNATSGTVTLGTVAGALGSVTASLPANTGTVAELNLAQTWTAGQSFTSGTTTFAGSTTIDNTGQITAGTNKVLGTGSGFTLQAAANLPSLQINGSNGGSTPPELVFITQGGTASAEAPVFSIGSYTLSLTGNYTSQRFFQLPQLTIGASGAQTLTNAASTAVLGPSIVNTNVTVTNDIGLWVQAGSSVAGGGTITTAIGLQVDAPTGGTANKTAILNGTGIFLPGLTTGTNQDVLCVASTGQVLIQAAASCTISSIRFKHDIKPLRGDALALVSAIEPVTFYYREGERPNADANFYREHIGLTAENIAAVVPDAAIFEPDGVTPKAFHQDAMIAVLVAAVQEQQKEIAALKAERHSTLWQWLGLD